MGEHSILNMAPVYLLAINVVTFLMYGFDKMEGQEGEMAHQGSLIVVTGSIGWQYRSVVGNGRLAS